MLLVSHIRFPGEQQLQQQMQQQQQIQQQQQQLQQQQFQQQQFQQQIQQQQQQQQMQQQQQLPQPTREAQNNTPVPFHECYIDNGNQFNEMCPPGNAANGLQRSQSPTSQAIRQRHLTLTSFHNGGKNWNMQFQTPQGWLEAKQYTLSDHCSTESPTTSEKQGEVCNQAALERGSQQFIIPSNQKEKLSTPRSAGQPHQKSPQHFVNRFGAKRRSGSPVRKLLLAHSNSATSRSLSAPYGFGSSADDEDLVGRREPPHTAPLPYPGLSQQAFTSLVEYPTAQVDALSTSFEQHFGLREPPIQRPSSINLTAQPSPGEHQRLNLTPRQLQMRKSIVVSHLDEGSGSDDDPADTHPNKFGVAIEEHTQRECTYRRQSARSGPQVKVVRKSSCGGYVYSAATSPTMSLEIGTEHARKYYRKDLVRMCVCGRYETKEALLESKGRDNDADGYEVHYNIKCRWKSYEDYKTKQRVLIRLCKCYKPTF